MFHCPAQRQSIISMTMGQSMKKLGQLRQALEEGDVSLPAIATLLDSGVSVNTQIDHASILYCAITKKQPAIVEFLLDQGANIQLGYFTETPLHLAAAMGDLCTVSVLLARGAKVNARNHNGCTPLWNAVRGGHLQVIEHLLGQDNIDVDCPCDDTFLLRYCECTSRTTALSLAVQNQNADVVRALLSKGAAPDLADVSGRTPLHHACRLGNLALAKCLVQSGCKLDAEDTVYYTPIHTAVCHDAADIVKLLVNAGCDVNITRTGDFCHPLHTAADRGNAEIVAILCSAAEVDINCRDRHKKTPLMVACKSRNIDCLLHLLGSGADVNVQDGNGLTLLSLALCLEEEADLQWRLRGLLKKSSGCHSDDNYGQGDLGDGCHGDMGNTTTVVDTSGMPRGSVGRYKVSSGHTHRASSLDVLHVLIQGGADLNMCDEYRTTAMYYALQHHKLQTACLLLCHGAKVSESDVIAALSFVSKRNIPLEEFARPAVVAFSLASFELWNVLHSFFYSPSSGILQEDSPLACIMKELMQPMTLARQCRSVIRSVFMGRTSQSVAPLVSKLPLPSSIKQFLLLSDVVEVVSRGRS
ncbi:hypothetical protein BaRGS_00017603 [Batillaria attramentaria]|uniref:SOCS box domain-containing protein n=1 Tax=Batillaria attramentaria TaxID=370345 RepID=A0ABD0KVV2_9CAEN